MFQSIVEIVFAMYAKLCAMQAWMNKTYAGFGNVQIDLVDFWTFFFFTSRLKHNMHAATVSKLTQRRRHYVYFALVISFSSHEIDYYMAWM